MEDTDIALMQRIQSGDTESFEILFARHHRKVLNIIYRYIGNASLSEDLVQEVFLRVYKIRKSYKPTAEFTTWLYEIVKNLCLNELKKKSRKTYSLDADQENPNLNHAQYIQSPELSPAKLIEQAESVRVIKQVIARLPPNQRMAVVLNKYEALSYKEISKIMGLSTKAVKSLLLRARTNIKEMISPYLDRGNNL